VFFIKNAGSLEYIPETLSVIPERSHAFAVANEAGLTLEEQDAQWKRRDFIMLQKGSIELAEKKGREAGILEGELKVALRLISKGLGVEASAGIDGGVKLNCCGACFKRGISRPDPEYFVSGICF
jgi:hypothetical protein